MKVSLCLLSGFGAIMGRDERTKIKTGFRPLADMTSRLMDPMLQKRAGINLSLLQSWEDIVGSAIGASSRPLRILWPRRLHEDDPFSPATLIIACEGFAALQIQHETGEIISRVNGFLGFSAIGRIKIEQKPQHLISSVVPNVWQPWRPPKNAGSTKQLTGSKTTHCVPPSHGLAKIFLPKSDPRRSEQSALNLIQDCC